MPTKLPDPDIQVPTSLPTDTNPYTTLSLPPTATPDQIKSAYRKAALKHHPDKAPPSDKQAAHTRFQQIAFAYAILSDEKRRRRYDTTGNTSESLDLEDDDFDWLAFYREQFATAVTDEAIESFAQGYKGGEEERRHVLAAYEKHEGRMERLYEDVMLSDVLEDEERFRGIIDGAIECGEVERYGKYVDESEKSRKGRITTARKRREKEAKEAEVAARELGEEPKSKKAGRSKAKASGKGDMNDLAALIQQRQKGREENFFDDLEARYCSNAKVGKAKKGAKRAMEEPSEEAFAKNRAVGRSEGGDATEGARRTKRSKKA